jgi:predicted membrane channel-forming protein YqfA (hemolysin III family)
MLDKAKRLGKSNLFLAGLVAGLILFLFSTDPNKLPIVVILFVLAWFYLIFSLITYHILNVLKLKAFSDSPRRQVIYSFIAGVVPTVILMLISINQLTARDLLLLTILGVVVLVYITRFRINKA